MFARSVLWHGSLVRTIYLQIRVIEFTNPTRASQGFVICGAQRACPSAIGQPRVELARTLRRLACPLSSLAAPRGPDETPCKSPRSSFRTLRASLGSRALRSGDAGVGRARPSVFGATAPATHLSLRRRDRRNGNLESGQDQRGSRTAVRRRSGPFRVTAR